MENTLIVSLEPTELASVPLLLLPIKLDGESKLQHYMMGA